MTDGVHGFLSRDWTGGAVSVVRGPLKDEFIERLAAGHIRARALRHALQMGLSSS